MVQPEPYTMVDVVGAGGVLGTRAARNDNELLTATEQYTARYTSDRTEVPFAKRCDNAGVPIAEHDGNWGSEEQVKLYAEQVCAASGLKDGSAEDVQAAVELMHKVLKPVKLTPEQKEHVAWPFRFKKSEGEALEWNEQTTRAVERMWSGMLGKPKAARFGDFHMHVFGRVGHAVPAIRKLIKRVLGLLLITRMVPEMARKMAQINIPKPTGGFRPLSITHDLYAMLTGEITTWFSDAADRAGLLPNSIAAYRKGLGTPQLTLTQQCAFEDAHTGGKPLLVLQDDFQKFYDACMAAFIVLSMQAAGLPPEGYIEWAAEATFNRRIIVVTSVGVTAALARAAGFLQGSAFSCCVVNFVVAVLVMRLWEGVAFTAKAPAGGVAGSATDHVTRASYGFNHGGGTVDSASFCDDNGRFTRRLPDLILMVVLFGGGCKRWQASLTPQ